MRNACLRIIATDEEILEGLDRNVHDTARRQLGAISSSNVIEGHIDPFDT